MKTANLPSLAAALLLASCAATAPAPAPSCPPAASAPPPPPASASAPPPPAPQQFAADAPAYTDDPGRRAKVLKVGERVGGVIAEALKKEKAPGVCVGLVHGGELVHASCGGKADVGKGVDATPDTLFRVGSITKTFTSAAIVGLRDRGLLSLDDPAEKHVPELSGLVYPTHDSPRITIRQLLTHTSGLPRDTALSSDNAPKAAEVAAQAKGLRLDHVPGTRYQYSNFGFQLLGVVVANLTGVRYREHVGKALLSPLGMSTVWDLADAPAGKAAVAYRSGKGGALDVAETSKLGDSEADGGLYASVRDLSRWLSFQLSAYPPGSNVDSGPLRRASVRESHVGLFREAEIAHSLDPKARETDLMASSVGLAWHGYSNCDEGSAVWHSGLVDGHSASVHMWPEAGVGLILLANHRSFDRGSVSLPLRRMLVEEGALSPRAVAPDARLIEASQRAKALIDRPDQGAYEKVFDPGFRQAVPFDTFVKVSQGVTEAMGACKAPSLVSHEGSGAVLEAPCERGYIELRVDMAGPLVAGFRVKSLVAPGKAHVETARAVAGLLGRFDAKVEKKHFAAPQEGLAQAFADVKARHGVCKAGEVQKGSHAKGVTLALTCERGSAPLELTVDLDEKGKATRAAVRAARYTRCPARR